MFRAALTIFLLVCLPASSQAATLNESDVPGGFGSSSQNYLPTYTTIGAGIDVIEGTLTRNNFDFIQFTNLDSGAQTISLSFGLIVPNANAFSQVGGQVRYSTELTTGPYTDNQSAGNFLVRSGNNIDPSEATATLSFSLDNTFAGGDLFVNILPNTGNRTAIYSLSAPGNIPAAVPVPPAGILLISALAALVLRRRVRRDALHPGLLQAT